MRTTTRIVFLVLIAISLLGGYALHVGSLGPHFSTFWEWSRVWALYPTIWYACLTDVTPWSFAEKPFVFSVIQASAICLVFLAVEILLKCSSKSARRTAHLLSWTFMGAVFLGGIYSIPMVYEMHKSWEMIWTSSSEPILFSYEPSEHDLNGNGVVNVRCLDSSTGSILTGTGWQPVDLTEGKNLAAQWERVENGSYVRTFVVRAKNGRRYLFRYDRGDKWTEMSLAGWPLQTPLNNVRANPILKGGIHLMVPGFLAVALAILLIQERGWRHLGLAGKWRNDGKRRGRCILYWFTPVLLAGITMFAKGLLVSSAYPPNLFWQIAPLFNLSIIAICSCGACIQILLGNGKMTAK